MSTKSEHHENEGFSSFPKMNPKSYYVFQKEDYSTELLGYSSSYTYCKNCPKMTKHALIYFSCDFPDAAPMPHKAPPRRQNAHPGCKNRGTRPAKRQFAAPNKTDRIRTRSQHNLNKCHKN